MNKITKAAAENALEKLRLGTVNQAFAGYWLSLWQGDELPRKEQFSRYRLGELTPNLVEFEVLPDNRVTVRSAGRETCQIVREDLNGIDWVMGAPIRNRRLRMRNFTTITNGAIMIDRRRVTMVSGQTVFNEELVLPFARDGEGIHPVVAHTDWKIERSLKPTGISEIELLAHDHRLLTIRGKTSVGP